MAIRKVTCKICLGKFETRSGNTKYCQACSDAARAVLRLPEYKAADRMDRLDTLVRLARQRLGIVVEEEEKRGRCRYCGRPTSHAHGYCGYCVQASFREIHMVTGRTTGWDRKACAGPDRTVGGWRGQKMAGGFSSDSIPHN